MTATDWPKVKLGEVLKLDLNKVKVDPSVIYPMVGVLSYGKGLFHREPVSTGNTSYKYFLELNAAHVIMSQLFGWEGALALCTEEFAGKFVSPQFPTFICEDGKVDRGFLGWALRTPELWEQLGTKTTGMGDRRRTLNPKSLFACEIPLPPMEEQRRLVAKIDALASKIEEAKRLREEADEGLTRLLIFMAHREDLSEIGLTQLDEKQLVK